MLWCREKQTSSLPKKPRRMQRVSLNRQANEMRDSGLSCPILSLGRAKLFRLKENWKGGAWESYRESENYSHEGQRATWDIVDHQSLTHPGLLDKSSHNGKRVRLRPGDPTKGTEKASSTQAAGSRTGDAKLGSLLLNWVASKSTMTVKPWSLNRERT